MTPNFNLLEKVLWNEQPDRVPFYEHLVDTTVMEAILGKKMPYKKEAHVSFLIEFFERMGYDYVPLELGPRFFRLNTDVSNRQEPLGRGSRDWVDNNRATIANQEEFEEYPWPEPEKAVDYELLEIAGKLLPDGMKLVSGVGGGVHEHTLWLTGIKPFSIALRKEPHFIKNLFNKVGSIIVGVDKIIAEMDHVGSIRMGDDMGYKGATMLSPKLLRENVFPWQKRAVEVAHKKGKPFILHSCGNLSEVIDDLIHFVGINAWHSFQDIILPVTEAKEKYGDRVAILGGVDVEVLCTSSIPEVKEYTRNVLERCMPGGGYALGSGNSITNYMKIENYKAMLEIGKKHGGYS
ncbi:MAG: uroporphyrinogen decarboxylase family protein [Candidatus Hodarchaeota archaeon]